MTTRKLFNDPAGAGLGGEEGERGWDGVGWVTGWTDRWMNVRQLKEEEEAKKSRFQICSDRRHRLGGEIQYSSTRIIGTGPTSQQSQVSHITQVALVNKKQDFLLSKFDCTLCTTPRQTHTLSHLHKVAFYVPMSERVWISRESYPDLYPRAPLTRRAKCVRASRRERKGRREGSKEGDIW